ncbi:MAG: hypothetical protein GXO44_01390 [Deferribacteres bacterium]|nr:hypothetical protein [Deferribacteres bacterium]
MDFKRCLFAPFNFILSQPVFLVPAIIPIVVNFVILFFGGASLIAAFTAGGSITVGLVIMSLLAVLIAFVAEFVAHAMLVHMAYTYETTGRVNLEESLQVSWANLGKIFLAAGIVSVAAAVGLFFFVIPGLIVLLFSIFTVQEIVINSKEPVEAIKGSVEIVKTHFGNVLGYFILLLIIMMVITGILNLIPIVGPLAATLITTPYSAISITLVYLELTAPVEAEPVKAEVIAHE